MVNSRLVVCLLVLSLLSIIVPMKNGVLAENNISGKVTDLETGEGIGDVRVHFDQIGEANTRQTFTNGVGDFSIDLGSNGDYDITLDHPAYRWAQFQDYVLANGGSHFFQIKDLIDVSSDEERYHEKDEVNLTAVLDHPEKMDLQFLVIDPKGDILTAGTESITSSALQGPPGNTGGISGIWRLDENSGTIAIDSSQHEQDGILKNGIQWTEGRFDKGLLLDGQDDHVLIDNTKGSLTLSHVSCALEAWVNPVGFSSDIYILSKGDNDSSTDYRLGLDGRSHTLTFGWDSTGGWVEAQSGDLEVPINTWSHVAVTFDDDTETLRYFVNGNLDKVQNVDFQPTDNSQNFNIGKGYENGSAFFKGKMDEVRVSDEFRNEWDFNLKQRASHVFQLSAGAQKGTYTVWANGTDPNRTNRTISAQTTFEVQLAVIPARANLAGEILDQSQPGRRLANTNVKLTSLDNESLVYSFTANGTGFYEGNNLEPGWYEYEVSKTGYWDCHGGIYLDADASLGRSFQLIPKQAGKGLVWGRVTNRSGEGLGTASVIISEGLPTIQAVDAAGYFEALVNTGKRNVIASQFGYRTHWTNEFTVIGLTQHREDLVLDTVSSITNTFIQGTNQEDTQNDPLVGVNIKLEAKGGRASSYETYSDANGQWQLGLDQGGDFTLTQFLSGYSDSQESHTIVEGQTTDAGTSTFQLKPTAHIDSMNTGYVGFAVRGETIQFQGSASGGSGNFDQYTWAYSKPGESSFEHLGDGASLSKPLGIGLQSGTYTLRFQVRDQNGQWSDHVFEELELVGRPQVKIDFDDSSPARYDLVSQFGTSILYADHSLDQHSWEVYVGNVGGEPVLTHDQSDFEVLWKDHGLQPETYSVRLQVIDNKGLKSEWDTRSITVESADNGDGRPNLIHGLQDQYGENDWLNLNGDTQGEHAKAYRWTINGVEVGTDQNLDMSLNQLQDNFSIELSDGLEYSVIFSYQRDVDDQWVESAEGRFRYEAGPDPHEVILPILFILFLLWVWRRRRKKRKARKLADQKAIPRPPAAPVSTYTVPQESLYDGGQAPYAPTTRKPMANGPQPGGFSRPSASQTQSKSQPQAPVFGQSLPDASPGGTPASKVEAKSAINYEKAHVIYKVKIENNTNKPLAEVKVKPFAPANLFKVNKEERTIGLIQPQQSQTATFKLRPRGECGNVDLNARVTYYDTGTNKYAELEVKPRETAIICPMLKFEDIDEQEWRTNVARMLKVEETTDKIPMDGESLYSMVSDVFSDLNLATVSMNVDRGRVFRGRAQFWAKGAVAAKGLGYAAQVEVIGGETKSKLILKAYAKGEDSLVGFYHCLLDEIEKRTTVRDYLDDGVTVQHIYGDMVQGGKVDIKDSVLQRSNIETSGGVKGDAGPPADSNGTPYEDVKGDVVGGSKVIIEDSVVTRSNVTDESDLDKGLDRLRNFVSDDDEK